MKIEFPDKLQCLFEPKRYKVLYGGRGASKSWGIARALLTLGASRKIRILCAREFQNSIQDSVHKLLSDQIIAMGLEGFYEIQRSVIKGANGTEFGFEGLRHNITKIKSWEGADIAWVEEAQTVSKNSWNTLIPTIRKEGSEIWISFNPELEEDETYQRFVLHPPDNAFVVKMNWDDNPWFPEVLRDEMLALKDRDVDAYLNVWEGHCRRSLEGAIYAEELRKAADEGRITRVPYDSSKPVATFWDLGWADHTSIWFAQSVGQEFRIIDYYQNQLKKAQHYTAEMQTRGYNYDRIFLPHDAANESLNAERTTEAIVKSAFPNATVTVLERLGIKEGIEAARVVFGQCWFDENKCADGLHALRHYRYEQDKATGQWSRNPLHDWSSHGADAFRYLAVAIQNEEKRRNPTARISNSWMG